MTVKVIIVVAWSCISIWLQKLTHIILYLWAQALNEGCEMFRTLDKFNKGYTILFDEHKSRFNAFWPSDLNNLLIRINDIRIIFIFWLWWWCKLLIFFMIFYLLRNLSENPDSIRILGLNLMLLLIEKRIKWCLISIDSLITVQFLIYIKFFTAWFHGSMRMQIDILIILNYMIFGQLFFYFIVILDLFNLGKLVNLFFFTILVLMRYLWHFFLYCLFFLLRKTCLILSQVFTNALELFKSSLYLLGLSFHSLFQFVSFERVCPWRE